MPWYRIKRKYRIADEVYILAPTARDALDQHWEGFAGVAYGFGDAAQCWATEFELAEDRRGELAPIRMGRVRRVELADVPAWMVNAAVKLKAQEKTPDIQAAVERWNLGTLGPGPHTWTVEDEPLRTYMEV